MLSSQDSFGLRDLERADQLVHEARERWPDVDGGTRGRTLEETFYRQIKIHLGEALLQNYMKVGCDRPEHERQATLRQIEEIGEWIIDSVTRFPAPPPPENPGDRMTTMRRWGMYYTHYSNPMARAWTLIGFAISWGLSTSGPGAPVVSEFS